MICRHCLQSKVNRPRGLCWSCYYTPGVRDLFPSTSKFCNRGVGNGCRNAPLPVPTAAIPGSEAKVQILADRARAGLALFHPLDTSF